MKDYMKPSLLQNPDHFTLHVGTNYLNTERSPEFIVKSIVDLAITLKGNSRDVSVSNIIVRIDNSNLNKKRCEVNAQFTEMCKGLVTHNDILKIYRIIQYSRNILKCNVIKHVLKYMKRSHFYSKN